MKFMNTCCKDGLMPFMYMELFVLFKKTTALCVCCWHVCLFSGVHARAVVYMSLQNAPAEEGMKFLCYYYKDRKEYDKSYRMASAMLDYSVNTNGFSKAAN